MIKLVPHWNMDGISDVEYISTGYSNQNYSFKYDSKHYIFRLPQSRQPFVDYDHESKWLEHLPEDPLLNKPLVLDTKTGQMISRRIQGPLLADIYEGSSDRQLLLDYVASLHDRLPECDRTYPLSDLLEQYGMIDRKDNQTTCARYVASHNDLNPWNVIVTQTGWATIDWEFIGNNDPLFDLVTLHQGLTLPMEELFDLCEQFENGCGQARVTKNLSDYWRRECGWAKYQISQGNRRQEILDQFSDAQQILASL